MDTDPINELGAALLAARTPLEHDPSVEAIRRRQRDVELCIDIATSVVDAVTTATPVSSCDLDELTFAQRVLLDRRTPSDRAHLTVVEQWLDKLPTATPRRAAPTRRP